MTTNGSLVDVFKLVIAFRWMFDAKRVVRDFEISVGSFMRNGCHVGSVGANPTWTKERLHTCLKFRILVEG